MADPTLSGSATTRTASVLNGIAGIWLIIAPFILGYTNLQAAMWDSIIVGIIVLVFAWSRAANPARYVGLSWLNLLLGIWMIISPFALAYSTVPVPTWNSVILGAIVFILAIWSAITTPALPMPMDR